MKKRHIANFKRSFDDKRSHDTKKVITLCGRVEGVKRIVWGFYGTTPRFERWQPSHKENICRTCLNIDNKPLEVIK